MRMQVEERHARILRIVRQRGSLRVAALAAELRVSPVTVRRDVETLAERGDLRRQHGVVSWPEPAARAGTGPLVGPLIGMVVPAAAYYFGEIIRGAQAASAALGGRLVLGISDYGAEEDHRQIERLLRAGVNGLLLTPAWASGVARPDEEARVMGLGVPTVLVERRAAPGTAAGELDRVGSDHAHGAALAVRHLAGQGHRRIALAVRDSPTAFHLRAGYRSTLHSLGLPAPGKDPGADLDPAGNTLVFRATRSEGFEAAALDRLTEEADQGRVDAVLVHSDVDAIMLVQRLQARGMDVPRDLALVAYDDELAALADIPLTAVAPPKRAVGETAVHLLQRQLTAPAEAAEHRHVELLPELHIRASCGARGNPR
ncbi:substrate-binding domain-containing protein [Streptacidiphilus carbonis]|uniref:substrate-binding domain-containing protein n=1 Tax=Streptacidiphilus carbonis TaxID=105422 RepID=UPI0005AAA8B9|nr:substrate-binding domain-containing protein [Streptacidiphilus carbonis]